MLGVGNCARLVFTGFICMDDHVVNNVGGLISCVFFRDDHQKDALDQPIPILIVDLGQIFVHGWVQRTIIRRTIVHYLGIEFRNQRLHVLSFNGTIFIL